MRRIAVLFLAGILTVACAKGEDLEAKKVQEEIDQLVSDAKSGTWGRALRSYEKLYYGERYRDKVSQSILAEVKGEYYYRYAEAAAYCGSGESGKECLWDAKSALGRYNDLLSGVETSPGTPAVPKEYLEKIENLIPEIKKTAVLGLIRDAERAAWAFDEKTLFDLFKMAKNFDESYGPSGVNISGELKLIYGGLQQRRADLAKGIIY